MANNRSSFPPEWDEYDVNKFVNTNEPDLVLLLEKSNFINDDYETSDLSVVIGSVKSVCDIIKNGGYPNICVEVYRPQTTMYGNLATTRAVIRDTFNTVWVDGENNEENLSVNFMMFPAADDGIKAVAIDASLNLDNSVKYLNYNLIELLN